jgi:ubiquinol-cytochrome c reductase cytochrome b subunit
MSYWGIIDAQNGIIYKKEIYNLDDLLISKKLNILKLGMNDSRIPSDKRIGPHNISIIDIFTGNLLGNNNLEKNGNGSRLNIEQEQSNKSYLIWKHKKILKNGYCNKKIPKIKIKIAKKGKIRYEINLKTWTYTSLNNLYNNWYKNNKKRLPREIEIRPKALAIWIKNDGSRLGKGIKLCTKNFTYSECKI